MSQDVLPPSRELHVARPTRVRHMVLAAGCTLAVLTYIQRLGFSRALPKLGLDAEQGGYLAAAFLVAYAVFQVPGGLLGDRFGARHLLTILVLCWSLLTAALALVVFLPAVGIWQLALLLLLRFLFGMFQAGGFPTWARVVADWMPLPERGLAQGTVWTFSRLGGALSGPLFLGLFWLFKTWTTPFLALGGLGVLWCGVFWPWFRNRPDQMQQVNAAERALIASGRAASAETSVPGFPSALWHKMLRSPSAWGLCLMYGFVGFAGNFVTGLLPDYLQKSRDFSDETTTWIFGLTISAGMVSCVLGGYLSDWIIRSTGNRKWGRRIVGFVGLAFAGLSAFAVPWTSEVWLLGLVFCAWFFFNDSMMGPSWASCADVGERHAGTLSGAMNMMGSLAGAGGSFLAGRLVKAGQEELLFSLFAGSYLLAALCWLLVDVTKPLTAPTPAGVEP